MMTIKFMNRLGLIAFIGLMLLSSCTKENSVTVVETEEEIELSFRMNINGVDIDTDALAAYCQTDTSEFIIIANKQENLTFPFEWGSIQEGDFVYFTSISESATWGYGGQGLGEEITGFSGLSILFSDAIITINSNDGNIVDGSSSGTLIGINDEGEFVEYPYSMDFVAEIIQESDFCE